MDNQDCCCSQIQYVMPYPQVQRPPCTGEECMFYKYAMRNPKVKGIIDYIMTNIEKEDDIFRKLAFTLGGNELLKAVLEGEGKDQDETISKTD